MTLTPYRQTLSLPGIKSLLVVATLARVPITAGAVTLTLHVVKDLGRGYGAAGLIGAAFTIGASLGAPVMGRFVDRRGLRPMLVLTTVAEVAFWTSGQAMSYWLLLTLAVVGGFLSLPAFSVARQSIAALAPEAHRLPAFALDSMTTELSFMAGPALGVLIATTAGPRWAMVAIAAGLLAAGVGLYALNPPVRAAGEEAASAGERVPRSSWLKPRLVAVLAVSMAATLVLSGTDVAVVAVLRSHGELSWTGLVLALWAVFSLLGGFAYGMVKRGLSPVLLFAPMAVLTIPVGLGGGHWWLLAALLLPAGALCAPTITASADAVSRLTPASARGEAMGLHNSALTVGVATGSPIAGLVMDTWSPAWGFAAVGGMGVLITLVVLPAELRRRKGAEGARPLDGAGSESGAASAEPVARAEPATETEQDGLSETQNGVKPDGVRPDVAKPDGAKSVPAQRKAAAILAGADVHEALMPAEAAAQRRATAAQKATAPAKAASAMPASAKVATAKVAPRKAAAQGQVASQEAGAQEQAPGPRRAGTQGQADSRKAAAPGQAVPQSAVAEGQAAARKAAAEGQAAPAKAGKQGEAASREAAAQGRAASQEAGVKGQAPAPRRAEVAGKVPGPRKAGGAGKAAAPRKAAPRKAGAAGKATGTGTGTRAASPRKVAGAGSQAEATHTGEVADGASGGAGSAVEFPG